MTREELEKLKGLTTEEITAKISSEEIDLPPKGKDRDDLLNFARLPADSGERNAFLDDLEKDGSPVEEKKEVQDAPVEEVSETPKPSEGDEGASSEPKWKQMGYDSEESALAALEATRNAATTLQEQVNKFNAERGQIGQRAKDLEAKLAAKAKELEEFQAKAKENAPPPKGRPKMPSIPKTEDFDDGAADDGYTSAMADYRHKVTQYESDLAAFDTSVMSTLAELRETVSEIKPKVEKISSFAEETGQTNATNATRDAWDEMWNSSKFTKFVDDYNLKTTVPVRQISDAFGIIGSDNPDPGSLAAAKALHASLSDVDRANYEKVRQALESFYDFSEGIPREKHYRTFNGCLNDLGLMGQYKYEKVVEPTQDEQRLHDEEKLRKDQEEATGLPEGRDDSGRMEQSQTPDEDKAEFAKLATEYAEVVESGQQNAEAWEKTDKWTRYKQLRVKLTGRPLPQFHKSTRY